MWMNRRHYPRTADARLGWRFFALAFAFSWIFWVPAALISHGNASFPLGILTFLGGFGPSIAGVVMVYLTQDEAGRQDFWQRVFDLRRIGAAWHAFIWLVFPVLVAVSLLVEVLSGRGIPFFPYLAAFAAEPSLVVWLPVIALQVALLGPLSEELGWRGYGLDALQARRSALLSSLIVGFLWSAWHIPLFFVRNSDNFYYDWGFGTLMFWLFLLRMTLFSVPMAWVYNNSGRSILSAILLHFAYNFTFSLVYPVPETMHMVGTVLMLALAVVIVIGWGSDTLTGRAQEPANGRPVQEDPECASTT
jgi:membrane protease YdiL (CAAX protease family)